MRLFLFCSAFVSALTLVPLGLAYLAEWLVPWSISAALWRRYAWVCAWAMLGASRGLNRLAHHLPGWHVRRWTFDLASRLSPWRMHVTSVALHGICTPCAEEAPDWWDFDVDCAGHECRECMACRGGYEFRHTSESDLYA